MQNALVFPEAMAATDLESHELSALRANGKEMAVSRDTNATDTVVTYRQGTGRWGRLLHDFSQETTLHGLRYTTCASSKCSFRSALWGITVLGAFAVFIYYTVDRVSMYLSFQKTVNVEVNYVSELEFPAITICNQNAFKITSATQGGWYQRIATLTSKSQSTEALGCRDGFLCTSGTACLPRSVLCDGFADCTDSSDEMHCDQCPRIEITSGISLPFLSGAASHVFHLVKQEHFLSYRYVGKGEESLYISLGDDGHWVISNRMTSGDIWARSIGEPEVKGTLPRMWSVWSRDEQWAEMAIVFHCTQSEYISPNMESLVTTPMRNISLKEMYVYGGHLKRDLIQSCKWKGEACSVDDFETTFTDLGLCYKFTPPSKIEKSGPGFGLGMTLNIEKYEYTKNVQSGVGVQLLLHADDDLPLMQERSMAISPGLYSLVSVERTQVDNLTPPWGNCSATDLEYYDHYSVTTCVLNCENTVLREKCGCIDIHMPARGDENVTVCSMDKYINCAKPGIDEHRRLGNCTCSTPCQEKVYVPSLSFSSITMDTESLTGADKAKLDVWRQKLSRAREVMYRVYPDKYKDTQKMFYTARASMAASYHVIRDVSEKLNAQQHDVIELLQMVNTDCINYMRLTSDVIESIEYPIRDSLSTLREYIHTQIYTRVIYLQNKIEDVILKYENFLISQLDFSNGTEINTSEDTTCTDDVNQFKSSWNETVLNMTDNPFMQCILKYMNFAQCYYDLDFMDYDISMVNISYLTLDEFWTLTDSFNITNPMIEECFMKRCPEPKVEIPPPKDMAKHFASELKPHYDSLLYALRHTLDVLRPTMYRTISDVTSRQWSPYLLRQDLARPLFDYLPLNCDWCMSRDSTSLIQILSRRITYSLGLTGVGRRTMPSLSTSSQLRNYNTFEILEYMQDMIVDINLNESLLNGTFLKDDTMGINSFKFGNISDYKDMISEEYLEDTQNTVAFSGYINQQYDEISKLSSLIRMSKQSMDNIHDDAITNVDTALHAIKGFREVISPKCRGELDTLQDKYDDSYTVATWVLDDIVTYINNYSQELDRLQVRYEAVNVTLESLQEELKFIEVMHFVSNKMSVVESSLNEMLIYANSTKSKLNRLYYWLLSQSTEASMRGSNLWQKFDIQSVQTSRPTGVTSRKSRPLSRDFEIRADELEAFWDNWDTQTSRKRIKSSISALSSQAESNLKYLEDFIAGNTVDANFYSQNVLELDIFYKELTERIVVQQKAYEYPALLCEVGGLLGLLLGASFLTLCEFLDLFVFNSERSRTASAGTEVCLLENSPGAEKHNDVRRRRKSHTSCCVSNT